MKNNQRKAILHTKSILNTVIKKAFLLPVICSLLCFISCTKDQGTNISQLPSKPISAFQNSAYAILKSQSTPQIFNDIDWNNVQVSDQNGTPYLLMIKSKTDKTKKLFYSEKNNTPYATWVQFNPNNNSSQGTIVVSSLSGDSHITSSYKNGRIYATSTTGITKNISALNTNSNSPALAKIATTALMDTISTTFTDDDPPAYSYIINTVVIINGAPIFNSGGGSATIYSLYDLLGNNPAYYNQYTTNTNSPYENVITIITTNGTTGIDPHFKKGVSPANGEATYTPIDALLGGWKATVGYTVATVNGVTTTSVVSVGAATTGALATGMTFVTTSTSYKVLGALITFDIRGDNVIGIDGVGYPIDYDIWGTYNTNTGAFSLIVSKQ